MDDKKKQDGFEETDSGNNSEENKNPEDTENLKRKQNSQVMWTLFLTLSLILIIVLVPFIVQNYVNKFPYSGLNFQKTKLGELTFFSTRIPIANIHGNVVSDFSMNFWRDPRDLENIPVKIEGNAITFKRDKEVYVTINPEMKSCEDNMVAISNFAGFLTNFGELNVKGASSKQSYSEENNFPYVTCKTHKQNTVIFIDSGNETLIRKVSENCYEINYKDCEILDATEKFMIVILEYYMGSFVRG